MYVNKCVKCGREFETKNPKRVICPDCLYPDKKMMINPPSDSSAEGAASHRRISAPSEPLTDIVQKPSRSSIVVTVPGKGVRKDLSVLIIRDIAVLNRMDTGIIRAVTIETTIKTVPSRADTAITKAADITEIITRIDRSKEISDVITEVITKIVRNRADLDATTAVSRNVLR